MILSMNSGVPQVFPAQKKSDAQKGKKFLKECVDAGVSLVDWEANSGLRKSKEEMVRLYNLTNGIIDPNDKKQITNPLNIQGYDFPGTAQTYPLITSLMSTLSGEEKNRMHNIDVTTVNSDIINQKQEYLKQGLDKLLYTELQEASKSEDEFKAKLQKYGEWANYSYKDVRERMAHQVLSYLRYNLSMDFHFSRGFEDLLTVGEEIYVTDIVAREPIFRKGNPLNFTFVRSNESPFPEDSDIIIEDGYVSVGKAIDDYHDELTDTQINKLEKGSSVNTDLATSLFTSQSGETNVDLDTLIEKSGGIGSILGTPSSSAKFGLSGAFDKHGRVRRTRVLWKSMRKVGFLSYVDRNGDQQETIVHENYKPNKEQNEEIKWQYISEWMEGTKLGEFYLKMQPRPVQFRETGNLSKCHPGIAGIINNVNSFKVTSLASSIKPIQYLYDEFVYRTERAFMTSYGNIARLDVSQIPDGWDMDKWLYYATTFKWAIQDPMKEGDEGSARGKLAGGMNQPANTFNLTQGNMIQENMYMLEYLENRANDIAGITPQRKGAISSRETMGGAERAVVQSSHRTEKWFDLHDNAKLRVYKLMLETTKEAWRDDKFKRSFFLDSMTEKILDFDGQLFNEAEYGIAVNNSKEDSNIKNLLNSSRDILLQNGFQLSSVIDVMRTNNITTMQRKIEKKEKEMQESKNQQLQAELKQREEENKRKTLLENRNLDIKAQNNIRDNKTKVLLDKDDYDANDNGIKDEIDQSKLEQQIQEHRDKLKLDEERLKEIIRHNKATEKKAK